MDTQPIVDRMQAKVIRMLADTEFRQRLLVQGLELNAGRCLVRQIHRRKAAQAGGVIRAAGLEEE